MSAVDKYKKSEQYANSIFDLINGDHYPTVDDLKLRPGSFRWCDRCAGRGTHRLRICPRCGVPSAFKKKERE